MVSTYHCIASECIISLDSDRLPPSDSQSLFNCVFRSGARSLIEKDECVSPKSENKVFLLVNATKRSAASVPDISSGLRVHFVLQGHTSPCRRLTMINAVPGCRRTLTKVLSTSIGLAGIAGSFVISCARRRVPSLAVRRLLVSRDLVHRIANQVRVRLQP